jgi:AhpD family alkylhydroperoxidase
MSYSEHADLARLRDLRKLAPTEFEGYAALSKIVGRTDGAIPQKYRELIALGVALTTQCAYCLDAHTASAKKAGATPEEIAEVTFITAALRAGAAVTHGTLTLKLFEGHGNPG